MGVSRRSQLRKQKQEQEKQRAGQAAPSLEDELPAQGELALDDGMAFAADPDGQEIGFEDDPAVDLDVGPEPDLDVGPAPGADSGSGRRGGRRSGRRSRTSSRRGRGATAGEVDAAFEEEAGANTGRSGRRSSRRSARTSARTSARRPVELTPEEQEEKRKAAASARRHAIILVLVLALIFGGAFAGYWFGLREKPEIRQAKNHLRRAETALAQVEAAVANGKVKEATELLDATLTEHLEIPLLGGGTIAELEAAHQAGVVAASQAVRAYEIINERIPRLRADIKQKEEELKARGEYVRLRDLTGQAHGLEEDQLVKLIEDIDAFCVNPELPGITGDPRDLERYRTLIGDLKDKLGDVESTLFRLRLAETKDVTTLCMDMVEQAAQRRRFSQGFSDLAEAKRKYPKADLGEARQALLGKMELHWRSARQIANEYFQSSQSTGVAMADRRQHLQRCYDELESVITNYGDADEVQPFVQQAKDLLAELKAKAGG